MDKPELDILTSASGKRMSEMVTADFYNQSFTGLWLYEAIGHEFDTMFRYSDDLRGEAFPQFATWSIAYWEISVGIIPDNALPLEYRRQRVLAKIIGRAPINPELLLRSVALFTGADVEIDEWTGDYTFDVILHPSDNPFSYFATRQYIRQLKPSHLSFNLTLETKVPIVIQIRTDAYPLGFGLTGTYNAGTKPQINVQGRVIDDGIAAAVNGQPSRFEYTSTGTRPQTNVTFSEDADIISGRIDADGNVYAYAPTDDVHFPGTRPDTLVWGGASDADIDAAVTPQSASFPYMPTGTLPQTNVTVTEAGDVLSGHIDTNNDVYAYSPTGTKPQVSETTSSAEDGIAPKVDGDAFVVQYPMTGTRITGG